MCMRILNVIRFVFARGNNHSGWQNKDCLFRVSVNDVIWQQVAACLHSAYSIHMHIYIYYNIYNAHVYVLNLASKSVRELTAELTECYKDLLSSYEIHITQSLMKKSNNISSLCIFELHQLSGQHIYKNVKQNQYCKNIHALRNFFWFNHEKMFAFNY